MKLLYLVGAPRISTGETSTTPGPRSHVLGFLGAVKRQAIDLRAFIAGDQRLFRRLAATEEGDIRGGNGHYVKLLIGDAVRALISLVSRLLLLRQVGHWSPDIVYERFATYQALGRRYRRRGALWVIECNGLFYREAVTDRKSLALPKVAARQESRAYRAADLVVAVSHAIKDDLVNEVKVPPERVYVLPNGVDTNLFSPIGPARRLWPEHQTVVGFVGQVVEWQGLQDLLRALVDLPSFVGCILGDGPYKRRLADLVEDLNLSERVTFVPRTSREQLVPYMRGFDIGFSGHRGGHNRRTYHSPLKSYEYAAVGLPIVSTPSDAVEELSSVAAVYTYTPADLVGLKAAIVSASMVKQDRVSVHREVAGTASWDARLQQLLKRCEGIRHEVP